MIRNIIKYTIGLPVLIIATIFMILINFIIGVGDLLGLIFIYFILGVDFNTITIFEKENFSGLWRPIK